MNIDFVITWVDGNDPVWQKEKAEYQAKEHGQTSERSAIPEDERVERYRNWGTLRYLFRGIEKYAPWVHKVFFVTNGQCPDWLNLSCQKLDLVRHQDFMDAEDLPTFNSNAIEMNLYRIPGLSEHFVYFNDDVFLTAPVNPEDFFIHGLPVDMLALQPVIANPDNPVMSQILLNDSQVIARHFRKWDTMKKHPNAYFHPGYPAFYFGYNVLERVFPQYTGFYTVHGPSPLLKRTYQELWKLEPECLKQTSSHRFRSGGDVTQYLLREWQKQKGQFVPRNILRDTGYFEIASDNRKLADCVEHRKKKMICVNDPSGVKLNEEKAGWELRRIFEAAFPQKSEFER